MDTKLARGFLVSYCASQIKNVPQPKPYDPKAGHLQRFFDDAKNFDSMLPNSIVTHLDKLSAALDSDTLALWGFSLAAHIQEWLLGPLCHGFSRDIRECLSNEFIANSKQAFKNLGCGPSGCEQSFCKGFENRILHDLVNKNLHTRETATQIQQLLTQVEYISHEQVDSLRIQALKDQLKVDMFNPEHGAFWEKNTTVGLFRFGGKRIQSNVRQSFKVPDTVHALMKQSDQVLLHYTHYLNSLTEQKEQYSLHYHILRKPLTAAFYRQEDLELTNVASLKPI